MTILELITLSFYFTLIPMSRQIKTQLMFFSAGRMSLISVICFSSAIIESSSHLVPTVHLASSWQCGDSKRPVTKSWRISLNTSVNLMEVISFYIFIIFTTLCSMGFLIENMWETGEDWAEGITELTSGKLA